MIELFNLLFVIPITNVLIAFYKLLLFLHIPSPLGFAIILLTVFIRIILAPFMGEQIKSAHKMQKVAPHIAAMKEKHKNDKKKQQEETMRLYREHGVNPAAGCLPLIIQFPITIALYQVLANSITITKTITIASIITKINSVLYFPFLRITVPEWNTLFFTLPLDKSPQALFAKMPLIILVPLLTGALQFVLSKMMMPEVAPVKKSDDMASTLQSQSLFIIPIMIGFFAWSLPIGLSLYWNTFTVSGIIHQYRITGPGGARSWIEKYKSIRNGRNN